MVLRFLLIAFLLLLGCGELQFTNPTDPYNASHPGGIAYKSFTDSRDGKSYNSVDIGTQTWMAENLNYATGGSYCVGNVERDGIIKDTLVSEGGYCDIYGRLYNWTTAQSICPSGWHLPNNAEWKTLNDFVGNSANKLKSTSGWMNYGDNGNGTDDYGFTAMPGGNSLSDIFSGIGSDGGWWSSTDDSDYNNYAYCWGINSYSDYISNGINCHKYKSGLFSVRCVKDGLCGSLTFNQGTQFCSNNIIYNMCGGKTYTPANQRCTGDVIEAKCGTLWIDAENQRCTANNGVETKCGTDWFDASNTNLRCQSNVLETKCGATGWYNPKNSNYRCENNVVETKCVDGGDNWYDASNVKLRCRLVSSTCGAYGCATTYAFELQCGSSWYSAKTTRCGENNALEYKCGTGTEWYNSSKQFCDYDNYTVHDFCGSYTTYKSTTQRCGTGNIVETKCGTGWYDATKTTTLRCQNEVVGVKCGTVWHDVEAYNAETYRCGTGNILETKCGTNWYDANDADLRCENAVVETKCGTVWYSDYETQYCSDGTLKSYGKLIDERDEKTYKTVEIGTQTWMAENLNYYVNYSKCYDDKESNCDIYGRLYSSDDHCPSGWHLPNKDEWETLINIVGDTTNAGTELKARTGWDAYNGNIFVNKDSYGFAALPGGRGSMTTTSSTTSTSRSYTYSSIGVYGGWHTSTYSESSVPGAYGSSYGEVLPEMASNAKGVKIESSKTGECSSSGYGPTTCYLGLFSIRCVKDNQGEN